MNTIESGYDPRDTEGIRILDAAIKINTSRMLPDFPAIANALVWEYVDTLKRKRDPRLELSSRLREIFLQGYYMGKLEAQDD